MDFLRGGDVDGEGGELHHHVFEGVTKGDNVGVAEVIGCYDMPVDCFG